MQLIATPDLAAEIDALAARHGGRVGIDAALRDLDRRLRRTVAPCRSRHRAWTWERADRRDAEWWPQGIAVAPGGRRAAVSWYAKHGGSRISLLDLGRRRYRHVTLVEPTAGGHEPLGVHAGGLAWIGSRLYVAATRAGLWVADTDDIVRTGHELLLPVRHRLAPERPEGHAEPLRCSFVSTDEAGRLVVGEYGGPSQTHRLAVVDPAGGPVELSEHGVARAQGGVAVRERLHLTASHGPRGLGSLWSGRPGHLRERRWALPMGPEDLSYDPVERRLWTVTEHPRRRWVVSVPVPRS